jgi:hypothetical protein
MIEYIESYYAPSFYMLHTDKKFYSDWCVNNKLKIIFITINKCASTSLKEYLSYKKFDIIDSNIIDYNYIICKMLNSFNFYSVIRNPKDRYISGLNEFMCSTKSNCDKKKFVENNIKNNKFIFDEHLLPQELSLHKVLKYNKKLILLKMDDSLSKKIPQILNDNSLMPTIDPYKDRKIMNLNFCIEMYEQYCKKNIKFCELYKKDFELYNISI